MNTHFFACALGLFLLPLVHENLSAQTDEDMAKVFNWKFSMAAPAPSFVPMADESGWEEPESQAKVICMATPTPYSQMAKDMEALSSEDGQKVIEKKLVEISGVQGLLVLLEFAPMAGEDTEIIYSLMFARPFEDVSLVLNAQYPKTQHERLYDKMLTAFGTVRKKDN